MHSRCHASGVSLVESLVALTLLASLVAITVPAATRFSASARAAAGARRIAVLLATQRWQSTALARPAGLLFQRDPAGWSWVQVVDGNGNGLRTAEVRGGVDPVVAGPRRLEAELSGARLGFPDAGPFPKIPPGVGSITDTVDPVQFGNTDLVSFGPLGSSSSGTIYVTDGRHVLFGVVLYGRSGRVRVWRLDRRTGGGWTL